MIQQEIQSPKTQPPPPPSPPPPMVAPTLHQPILPAKTSNKQLTFLPLIFLIYFEVSGGPYGSEPVVAAAGPSSPSPASSSSPSSGPSPRPSSPPSSPPPSPATAGILWAHRAFGAPAASLMATWKFLSGVTNNAAYPVVCADYLSRAVPALSGPGLPCDLSVVASNLLLSALNYSGLTVVGYLAMTLCFVSLLPFLVMSAWALPKIRPARWGKIKSHRDWRLFFNTLFWNLNFWDNASTMAGEVERPQRTFPRALAGAGVMTVLGYLIPLMAVTGALDVSPDVWVDGFYADAAGMIAGKWLKYWIEAGAVLSAIGLYEAQLSSSSFQLLGMADLGFLPRIFSVRSTWFNTPWLGILTSSLITLAISFLSFSDIISSANFLYSLGMLLEIASFLWLRKKHPNLKRPYRVPVGTAGLACMCLVPAGFLIFVMALASWKVFVISIGLTLLGVGLHFVLGVCKNRGWLEFSKEVEEVGEEEGDADAVRPEA